MPAGRDIKGVTMRGTRGRPRRTRGEAAARRTVRRAARELRDGLDPIGAGEPGERAQSPVVEAPDDVRATLGEDKPALADDRVVRRDRVQTPVLGVLRPEDHLRVGVAGRGRRARRASCRPVRRAARDLRPLALPPGTAHSATPGPRTRGEHRRRPGRARRRATLTRGRHRGPSTSGGRAHSGHTCRPEGRGARGRAACERTPSPQRECRTKPSEGSRRPHSARARPPERTSPSAS